MKKSLCVLFAASLCALTLAGCGEGGAENRAAQTSKKTINEILAESQAQATTVEIKLDYPELDYTAEIDLTALNSNMVYSTVNSMVTKPEDYMGKTVKASGTFDVFTSPSTGEMFYACIIADATACCSQGLEFVWKGDHSYPGDYPKTGDPITIGGEFETYKDKSGGTYCRLNNAEVAF